MSSKKTVEVGSFSAKFHDVVLPMGLKASLIEVTGQEIAVSHHPFEFHAPTPGSLKVTILEGDLAEFLNRLAPAGLKQFHIEAKDQKVYIQAIKTVLIDVKANVVCTLRIEGETQLFIDLESVEIMGAGAKNLLQSQLDRINPVLDAADLPVEARLLWVEVGSGKIVLEGTLLPR